MYHIAGTSWMPLKPPVNYGICGRVSGRWYQGRVGL